MNLNYLFCFSFLLFVFKVNGQEQDTVLAKQYLDSIKVMIDSSDCDKAYFYGHKASSFFGILSEKKRPLIANALYSISLCYALNRNYNLSLEVAEKTLHLQKKIYKDNHLHFAYTNNLIGGAFYAKQDFDKALGYFRKSISILNKSRKNKDPLLGHLYTNIGMIYSARKEQNLALEFLKKGLANQINTFGGKHPIVATTYSKIGSEYLSLNKYERALEFQFRALKMQKRLIDGNHNEIGTTLSNIAMIYRKMDELDKALEYNYKALNEYLKSYNEINVDFATVYNDIGKIFERKNSLDSAIFYYKKALEIDLKTIGEGHSWVIEDYNRIGNVYQALGNFSEATKYYEKGIYGLDTLRKKIIEPNAKQFHIEKRYGVFENAIKARHLIAGSNQNKEDLKKCFIYSEKSKSNILLESLINERALSFFGISKSLYEKENSLKKNLSDLERKLASKTQGKLSDDDSTIVNLRSMVFDLKQEYNEVIRQLEKQHPVYFDSKYKIDVVTVDYVQENLIDYNQALIEYFNGNEAIYIFVITKDNFNVYRVEKDFPLKKWIQNIRNGIYKFHIFPNSNKESYGSYIDTFTIASVQLYKKLIAPIDIKLPEQIIVVSDGILNYLPFEALLKEDPIQEKAFKSHAYLIKDHQISYCYSATLLQEMYRKKNKGATKNLLAFAPSFVESDSSFASSFGVRGTLGPLPNSIPEAKSIQSIIGGEMILGDKASKSRFLEIYNQYQIIHLATHAKANDKNGDYSFLAFGDTSDSLEESKLYVRELYNMQLNSDLVVLSACETGIGELQRGEGIISLARGFSYAGAKSIVTSLWSVNDASTKELMEGFYRYLKKGFSKDAALRQAKLDYIENHTNDEAAPFYWAGFIPIGDMSPIDPPRSFWWIWLLVLSIPIAYFFFLKPRMPKAI